MKLHAPAAERNEAPIREILARVLPATPGGVLLELASGSGQHAEAFARAFPHLVVQPSDPDPRARASIDARAREAGLDNLRCALELDATQRWWPSVREPITAVMAVNMVHISPWEAALGLLDGSAALLSPGAPLYLYGPYILDGDFLAESNVDFDRSLRGRDPRWGLREVRAVERAANERGLVLEEVVPMPANNLSLVLRRR